MIECSKRSIVFLVKWTAISMEDCESCDIIKGKILGRTVSFLSQFIYPQQAVLQLLGNLFSTQNNRKALDMSTAMNPEESNGKETGEGQPEPAQEDEEDTSCAICMMPLDDDQMRCKLLSCQHDIFHYDCLMKWAQIRLSCPLCKIMLTTVCYGDRVVHIESFLASQRLQQNPNQPNMDGSGMQVEDNEYDDDDYDEDDDDEDYYDACAVCGEECFVEESVGGEGLSEMGPSVFCNCGECVHWFCIGRR